MGPAVVGQRPNPIGQLRPRRDDRARVAEGAQVLPRIEAEAGRVAERPGPAAVPFRTVSLRGVFDDENPGLCGDGQKTGHVRHLPEQMYDDDGPGAGVSAALSVAGVMSSVSSLTSAKRGAAPARTTAAAVAMKVFAGTTTSSPGPIAKRGQGELQRVRSVRRPLPRSRLRSRRPTPARRTRPPGRRCTRRRAGRPGSPARSRARLPRPWRARSVNGTRVSQRDVPGRRSSARAWSARCGVTLRHLGQGHWPLLAQRDLSALQRLDHGQAAAAVHGRTCSR